MFQQYLRRYGYLSNSVVPNPGQAAALQANNPFTTAIRRFQRMAGLIETGQFVVCDDFISILQI